MGYNSTIVTKKKNLRGIEAFNKSANTLIGKRFNKLTAIEAVYQPGPIMVICLCDCGEKVTVSGMHLKSGNTKSCGCLNVKSKKHGHKTRSYKSPEYTSWLAMKSRCSNVNDISFKNYGAKGVLVCKLWYDSFEAFLLDMGEKPTSKHSIDRFPNKQGNYEPSNCRWATRAEQGRNQITNVWLEYNGAKKIAADWATLLKISQSHLSKHLKNKTFPQTIYFFEIKGKIINV